MEKTFVHSLLEAKKRGGKIAALHKKNDRWVEESWAQFYSYVESTAAGLKSLGIERGDRVAIASNTRFEWSYIDCAILAVGAITVPIYPSSTEEDMSYILQNSETKALFCEDQAQVAKWRSVSPRCPTVKSVVSIDRVKENAATFISDFMEQGKKYLQQHPDFLAAEIQKSRLSDTATILYTSGTTGVPKGVVITHEQIISEIEDVFRALALTTDDRNLAFLPLSHIFGRVEMWGQIYVGFSTGYAENIEKIRANLGEIQPTFLIAVPRIFEKIYNGVVSKAETSPVKFKLFKWALGVGRKVSKAQRAGQPIPAATALQYKLATKLVFEKLHKGLGGRLKWALSGSAPLSKEIAEFFHAAGILVLEGYGLTETTAGITVNTPFDFDFGSVGKPIGDTQIKIAEDGEILVKSKKVMKEYYKNPEATAEAIKDGWFYTGDIGEFTPEGRLKITDRKKDLIKTAGGKYVAPQKLENLLKLNKYISNALIHGDQKKYVVALLTLDPEHTKALAAENNLAYSSFEELVKNDKVQSVVRDAVASVNSSLASYESIKNFAILPRDFTIEDGELTPSLKVKRKVCDKKYGAVIDGLYGNDRSSL